MRFNFNNRLWWPREFAICLAWDAFRIALGEVPQHFTLREVVTWLSAQTAPDLSESDRIRCPPDVTGDAGKSGERK